MTQAPQPKGDLSVTALYTSETWRWGGFDGAELLATQEARVVFRITNFVLGLVRLVRWNIPSLRHSLVHRHTMIDHLVRECGTLQVLELAAGLSRRGSSFSKDTRQSYVELDLPGLVAKKRELFARSEEGKLVLQRSNYRIAAGDIESTELDSLVDVSQPVVVVAEGIFMYLKQPVQRDIWHRIAELVGMHPSSTFMFDLVPACEQPRPGVLGRLLERAMKRFTGGRAFEVDQRTRHDLVAELRRAGFSQVELYEPANVAAAWKLPFPRRRTQVLLFSCR